MSKFREVINLGFSTVEGIPFARIAHPAPLDFKPVCLEKDLQAFSFLRCVLYKLTALTTSRGLLLARDS